MPAPNWRKVYQDRFLAVRERLMREVRDGVRPYMRYEKIQAKAREEARRNTEGAINEYHSTGEDHPQNHRTTYAAGNYG